MQTPTIEKPESTSAGIEFLNDTIKIATWCYCYKKEDYQDKIQMYKVQANRDYKCCLCNRKVATDCSSIPKLSPKLSNIKCPSNHTTQDPNPHLQGKFGKPKLPLITEELREEILESGWDEALLTPDEAAEQGYAHEFLYYHVWNEDERRRFQDLKCGYEEELYENPPHVDSSLRYHLSKNWNAQSIMINGEKIDLS